MGGREERGERREGEREREEKALAKKATDFGREEEEGSKNSRQAWLIVFRRQEAIIPQGCNDDDDRAENS